MIEKLIPSSFVLSVALLAMLTALLFAILSEVSYSSGYNLGQKAEARKRISECLNEINEEIYPSEMAERLHIDYDLCVEIIEELLKEGEVELKE